MNEACEECGGTICPCCGRWLPDGTGTPHRPSQDDAIERFVATLLRDERLKTASSALYANYKSFCEQELIKPVTQVKFGRVLSGLGIEREHTRNGTVYIGIS